MYIPPVATNLDCHIFDKDQTSCINTSNCFYTNFSCYNKNELFSDVKTSTTLFGSLIPIKSTNNTQLYYLTLANSTDKNNFLIKKISTIVNCSDIDPKCNFLLPNNIDISSNPNLLKYYMVLYNGSLVRNITQYPLLNTDQVVKIQNNNNSLVLTDINNISRTVTLQIVDTSLSEPAPLQIIDQTTIDKIVNDILKSNAGLVSASSS